LASVDGLTGLTIGNLATVLRMSKSGVYAHFGSKEELQLATIAKASELFDALVLEPARREPPGLARVLAFCDAYLASIRGGELPSGCFFAAVTLELSGRPGPVRQAVAEHQELIWGLVFAYLAEAREAGQLDPEQNLEHLMLELQGILLAANSRIVVDDDESVLRLAAEVIRGRLGWAGPARDSTRPVPPARQATG
jgi:AcrR family transcriptional regulator